MSSRMRAGVLAGLLAVGCSPAPAPGTAGVTALEAVANQAAMAGMPARTAAASAGDTRQRPDDIVVLAAWSRDFRFALRAQAHLLAGRADGRSQLAAAWLLRMAADYDEGQGDALRQDAAAFAALLVRAGELAPDDPLIAWLERTGCPASQPLCRPEQTLARLQRLEPDNAATWLATLEDAVANGDHAAADRALVQAGRAGYYDSYWGEAGHFLDATLADVPLPPRSAAVMDAQRRQANGAAALTDADLRSVSAIAMASALATPALASLMRSCRSEDAAVAAARRSPCLAVAVRLAESDTLLGRRLGLGLAVRLTADKPAGAGWREQLRSFLWLQEQLLTMGLRVPPGYAQSLWHVGEVAALQAWLTATGRVLTPPPGWLPSNVEDRTLITTGRAPPPEG